MTSALTTYALYARDLTKSIGAAAKDPVAARETAYYNATIGSIKTADDFVNNTRLLNYATAAFGLGDLSYAKGLFKKILKEGLADAKSYANRATDPRFRQFAKAFDFAGYGALTTSRPEAQSEITTRYARQSFETQVGDLDQGVRLALYFQRQAPSLTSSYGILADKALSEVVRTAFNIPASTANQNIDLQAKNIDSQLKLADLKDPAKLDKFIKRFLVRYDVANNTAASPVSLLLSNTSAKSFSVDLLQSLQGLRLGG